MALAPLPGPEGIAEREHIGIGADAGVAEQIPGPTQFAAPFENRVALGRALRLQVIAGTDAGEAGADDEDIEMFDGHELLPLLSDVGPLPCRERLHGERPRCWRSEGQVDDLRRSANAQGEPVADAIGDNQAGAVMLGLSIEARPVAIHQWPKTRRFREHELAAVGMPGDGQRYTRRGRGVEGVRVVS